MSAPLSEESGEVEERGPGEVQEPQLVQGSGSFTIHAGEAEDSPAALGAVLNPQPPRLPPPPRGNPGVVAVRCSLLNWLPLVLGCIVLCLLLMVKWPNPAPLESEKQAPETAQTEVDKAAEPIPGVSFKQYDGYLPIGDYLYNDRQYAVMTVQEAKRQCALEPNCKGFTLQGDLRDKAPGAMFAVWLKTKWVLTPFGDEPWTSFKRQDRSLMQPKAIDPSYAKTHASSRPSRDPLWATSPLTQVRGVAYSPLPKMPKDAEGKTFPEHFVMGKHYQGQWGADGRNDLGMIAQLGGNSIFLRGRGPWHRPRTQEASGHKPSCNFKWYKFKPVKTRKPASSAHRRKAGIGGIKFYSQNTEVNLAGATAKMWEYGSFWDWSWYEDPKNAIDGDPTTKAVIAHLEELVIEFPNAVEVDAFSFSTAFDEPNEDPVQFILEGSRGGELWTTLYEQEDTDYATPMSRNTPTELFSWHEGRCRPKHRTYFNARLFFDTANSFGIKVIVSMSDYQFFHTRYRAACATEAEMDCYSAIKRSYRNKMQQGMIVYMGRVQSYHPAIDVVNLMNDPTMKFASDAPPFGPKAGWLKALLSAFDGMLKAEHDRGFEVAVAPVRFTITFAYESCYMCKSFLSLKALGCCVPCGPDRPLGPCEQFGEVGGKMQCILGQDHTHNCPVLAQLMDIHNAMKDPASVGYTPRMKEPSLYTVYKERWVHSFHANGPFSKVKESVLDRYEKLMLRRGDSPSDEPIPIMIGEYRSASPRNAVNFGSDVEAMQTHARSRGNSFMGMHIYTFLAPMDDSIICDEAQWHQYLQGGLADNPCPDRSVGLFIEGDLKMGQELQIPVPADDGTNSYKFTELNCLRPAVAGKLTQLARVFKGSVPDTSICDKGPAGHPQLYCIANRSATKYQVRRHSEAQCETLRGVYDCEDTPTECLTSYKNGDWVFSVAFQYYNDHHPHQNKALCNHHGTGVVTYFPPYPECTADPKTVDTNYKPLSAPSPSPESPGSEVMLIVGVAAAVISLCLCFICLQMNKRVHLRWASVTAEGTQDPFEAVPAAPPLLSGGQAGPSAQRGAAGRGSVELVNWS